MEMIRNLGQKQPFAAMLLEQSYMRRGRAARYGRKIISLVEEANVET